MLARRPHSPGAAALRAVLHGDVHVTLSKLERRFLARLRAAGLPLPQTNRPAGGRRVDCRWPELRLTVELDSYRYHRSRHAWEQDRRREREARRAATSSAATPTATCSRRRDSCSPSSESAAASHPGVATRHQGRTLASQSGPKPGSRMRPSFGSASIWARSSSLSSKSKTSKFSSRRSWLEAFGIVAHLRLVEQPPQRDLARGLAVALADLAQRRVARDLAAGERGVGGDHEVLLRRQLDELVLAQEGVELDLVGEDRRELQRLAEHVGREVRDAEVLDQALVAERGERAERLLERQLVVGPVQEQEVEAVDLQALERALGRRAARSSGANSLAPELRGEEQLLARDVRRRRAPCPTSASLS